MNAKETGSRVFMENVASGRISALCQYCNHPESRSITQNSRLASTFTSSLLFPPLSCDRTACTGVKLYKRAHAHALFTMPRETAVTLVVLEG